MDCRRVSIRSWSFDGARNLQRFGEKVNGGGGTELVANTTGHFAILSTQRRQMIAAPVAAIVDAEAINCHFRGGWTNFTLFLAAQGTC